MKLHVFNKALHCDDKFCPDLSTSVMRELVKLTPRDHVWDIQHENDFAEEESLTIQVELVSVVLTTTWSVFTARVDDDTTMQDVIDVVSDEIQPLPSGMSYSFLNHKFQKSVP